ncbi:MAG: low specificity L-threonine aldolase, partial [Pseudomonadota bacterium]
MEFSSDNWAGVHPHIAEALSRHSTDFAAAYGNGELDRQVEEKFSAIFERNVAVFFVGTGTAANALSLAATGRPGGIAFCHRDAHLIVDEGGATEFLATGTRLVPVDGDLGKMDPVRLEAEIGRFPPEFVHAGQPAAVSVSQLSEVGTHYSLDEIGKISEICRKHGLSLHMDGARFANATAALGVSPADLTWRRGVDILSFGATKNGCWCAEAVVVFDPDIAKDFPFIRKRSAHLFSKSRFIAAQFEAYFQDDLWMHMASHANQRGSQLRQTIGASANARLAWENNANQIFAVMSRGTFNALIEKGVRCYEWHTPDFAAGQLEKDEPIA